MSSRLYNRGGTLSYVIVGVFLLALLAGAILVVRNIRSSGVVSDTGADDSKVKKDDNNSTSPAESALKEALEKQSKQNSDESDNSQNDAETGKNDQSGQNQSTSSNASSDSDIAKLPETGPGDTIASIFGMVLLVGALTAYGRSRLTL